MCGYCVERNQLMLFWQYGRFEHQADLAPYSSHFISLECPNATMLNTLQQQGETLEPELVLIRLACDARSQTTTAAAVPLVKAMLGKVVPDSRIVSAIAWAMA